MPQEKITGRMMIGEDEVIIDGIVHYHVDNNYGADADNKRGERRTIIDDVTDINFTSMDGEEVKFTEADVDRASEILGTKFEEG